MKTARNIVQGSQRVIPKDKYKKYYIVARNDWRQGDIAAEIALSSHSGKWLCFVYSEMLGQLSSLCLTGVTKEQAMKHLAYVKSIYN